MLNFGYKNLMHSSVGVGIGELEEIIAVELRDFFACPLIFKFVQIPIDSEMLSTLNVFYLFSSECNF